MTRPFISGHHLRGAFLDPHRWGHFPSHPIAAPNTITYFSFFPFLKVHRQSVIINFTCLPTVYFLQHINFLKACILDQTFYGKIHNIKVTIFNKAHKLSEGRNLIRFFCNSVPRRVHAGPKNSKSICWIDEWNIKRRIIPTLPVLQNS